MGMFPDDYDLRCIAYRCHVGLVYSHRPCKSGCGSIDGNLVGQLQTLNLEVLDSKPH